MWRARPWTDVRHGDPSPRLTSPLWAAGMFYWVRSLQTYSDGWDYISNLKEFVRGGMKDGAFIDAVSG